MSLIVAHSSHHCPAKAATSAFLGHQFNKRASAGYRRSAGPPSRFEAEAAPFFSPSGDVPWDDQALYLQNYIDALTPTFVATWSFLPASDRNLLIYQVTSIKASPTPRRRPARRIYPQWMTEAMPYGAAARAGGCPNGALPEGEPNKNATGDGAPRGIDLYIPTAHRKWYDTRRLKPRLARILAEHGAVHGRPACVYQARDSA